MSVQSVTLESLQNKESGHAKLVITSSIFQLAASQIGPDQAGIKKQDRTRGDARHVRLKTKRCLTITIVSAEDREIRISELEKCHTVAERSVVEPESSDVHIHALNSVIQDLALSVSCIQQSRVIVERRRRVSDVDQDKKLGVKQSAESLFHVVNTHVKKSVTLEIVENVQLFWNKIVSVERLQKK